MDLPPDVALHLDKFRDRLPEAVELRGLYLYGSLTTGDFSRARSDIDLIAVPERRPDRAALGRLESLHLDLGRAGGAFSRLNCLYVTAGTLADPQRLHPYWYGNRFTEWQLKLMTMAELAHSGRALYGPWPPTGLREVSLADLQSHVRDDLDAYWLPMVGRPDTWLEDRWVDFGLVTLLRAAAVLHDGELITKSEAIGRLADFGVPAWLSDQIRHRRAGGDVSLTKPARHTRASLVRKIMADGIRELTEPRG